MAEKDELLEHNYDGIKEYDNDLPRWWVQLFWLTALGGLIYIVWFHFLWGSTPDETLRREIAELHQLQAKGVPATAAPELTDEVLLAMVGDSTTVSRGQGVFASKCVACHGALGGGIVGPNLTDKYWIHGGTPLQIRKVIVEGVSAKGMLAWGTTLPADEIDAVTAYILSLHGTNPPGAKAPEGEPLDPS